MIKLLEKLMAEDFEDVFKPASEDEVDRRREEWIESLSDKDILSEIQDYLEDQELWELERIYNERSGALISLKNMVVDAILDNMHESRIKEWFEELVEEGEIEP